MGFVLAHTVDFERPLLISRQECGREHPATVFTRAAESVVFGIGEANKGRTDERRDNDHLIDGTRCYSTSLLMILRLLLFKSRWR